MNNERIVIGVENLVYAKMTSDGATPVYGAVKPLADLVNLDIKPNQNTQTLYASNVAVATATSHSTTDVNIDVSELEPTVVNDLLGITANADGVNVYNDAIAPYIAIGFKSLLSGGTYRYVWLTKGQFKIPEDKYATKGENVDFQTKTIEGTFIPNANKVWKFEVDEKDLAQGSTVATNWFTAVYQPA